MNRVAVFVDAGYLFAQGGRLLTGQRLQRRQMQLKNGNLVEALRKFAEETSEAKLLRIYWYDGTSAGPSDQHRKLASMAGVKVRLGFVNSHGEQKGVDSLIVTDMITLARNRAMSEAVLLSGDEDLRVGVMQAQEFGVRVHLLGIKPAHGSQSLFLLQEADSSHEWEEEDIRPFLQCDEVSMQVSPPIQPTEIASSSNETILRQVAEEIAATQSLDSLQSLIDGWEQARQIPKDVDGWLLGMGRQRIGRDLEKEEKKVARHELVMSCKARLESLTQS